MTQRLAHLLLLSLGSAAALNPGQSPQPRPGTLPARPVQTQPAARPVIRAAPVPAATPLKRNYVNELPQMIRQAQQTVIYAPKFVRADIPEAVRLSMNERGSTIILFTNPARLMEPNSLTFRLQLMGNPTYAVTRDSEPFIILDGVAYTGPGITNTGPVYRSTPQRSQQLIRWAQGVIDTTRPLNLEETLKKWTKKNLNITLN